MKDAILFSVAENKKAPPYNSLVRQRQADDTRRRIVEATRQLLQSEGYAGMTIEAIAQRAEVSAQSVYAIFKSKTGVLAELIDQSSFGTDYQSLVQEALGTNDPEARLRMAARIARQFHEAQSATFDLLRGAGAGNNDCGPSDPVALAANRRRWSSLKRNRLWPNCSRSTRFSSRR